MMTKSTIDEKLTPLERKILAIYRHPKSSDLRREVRMSIQYAIGTGIFLLLAIWRDQPLYGIVVYAVFVWWMVIRLIRARKLVGVMPRIIEKYESEITLLKVEAESELSDGIPEPGNLDPPENDNEMEK